MKAAVQELPEQAGIQLANWYWKGVRQFVWERFGTSLSRSSCLNWLRRLGFAFKRPKKRLLKADGAGRSYSQGPKRSCQIPRQIPRLRRMRLPSWLWFSTVSR